jgi:hypothetical protein
MDLRLQAIEHPHAVPGGKKLVCEMRPDETGASRDQDVFHAVRDLQDSVSCIVWVCLSQQAFGQTHH